MTDTNDEITRLLAEWSEGDETALERLMPRVTDELRRIAGRFWRKPWSCAVSSTARRRS